MIHANRQPQRRWWAPPSNFPGCFLLISSSENSSSPVAALDLHSLNFDACERLALIISVLEMLPLVPDMPILDVGGHPGLLAAALPARTVITLDLAAVGPEGYVRGSGAALPFRSESFAVVVASDTLEHVPPAQRATFLGELARVTRQYLILGGPFDTVGVSTAERYLRELLPSGSLAAGWLQEHADFGLPDINRTRAAVEQQGLQVTQLPSGDLVSWFLLFSLQAVAEYVPKAAEAVQQFMPDYNRHFGKSRTPSVSYRHLLVGGKQPLPESISALQFRPLENIDKDALLQIDVLHSLFTAIVSGLKLLHSRDGSAGAEMAYIQQLEKALLHSGSPKSSREGGLLSRLREKLHAREEAD